MYIEQKQNDAYSASVRNLLLSVLYTQILSYYYAIRYGHDSGRSVITVSSSAAVVLLLVALLISRKRKNAKAECCAVAAFVAIVVVLLVGDDDEDGRSKSCNRVLTRWVVGA